MIDVSQAEAMQNLPSLLKEARTQPVRIADEDGEGAFLVSAKSYELIRETAIRRMEEISKGAGERLAGHAAELGMSPDELVAELLRDQA